MRVPKNPAFTPDGNRRKAERDHISLMDAYIIGAKKGIEVVNWCRELGIKHATFFGSSGDNVTKRPSEEFLPFFFGGLKFCRDVAKVSGATLHVFGDIAGISAAIPPEWKNEFLELQRQGLSEGELVVHVGINYSATADLVELVKNTRRTTEDITVTRLHDLLLSAGVPDVDLYIRTGGRQRLSGFLPYQLRYAELYFFQGLWSEFLREDFDRALGWFAEQDCNFGE